MLLAGCLGGKLLHSSNPESTPTVSAIFRSDYFIYPTLDATSEWYKLYGIDFDWEWEGQSLSSWEWDTTFHYDNTMPDEAFAETDEIYQTGGEYEAASAAQAPENYQENSDQTGGTAAQSWNPAQGGGAVKTQPDELTAGDGNGQTPLVPISALPNQIVPLSTPRPADTPASNATNTVVVNTLSPDVPTPTPSLTPTPTFTSTPTNTPTFTPTPTPTPICGGNTFNEVGRAAEVDKMPIDFEEATTWTRSRTTYGTLRRSNQEAVSGNYSAWICYNFETAQDDTAVFMQIRPLEEQPNTVKAWVFGDYSSHYLSVWILDRQQETWQIPLGLIEHAGWKEMEVTFTGANAVEIQHISGPENGRIDFPIYFRGIALNDRWDAATSHGIIFIDDVDFVREE